jgi:hypothetical protein
MASACRRIAGPTDEIVGSDDKLTGHVRANGLSCVSGPCSAENAMQGYDCCA